jgi:ribosomal protein S18 acetylase RimI-like enzyme
MHRPIAVNLLPGPVQSRGESSISPVEASLANDFRLEGSQYPAKTTRRQSTRFETGAAPLRIEFSKASVPQEIDALCEFDKIVFGAYPSDLFDKEDWAEYDSYWMTLDGKRIGCSAFAYDIDFDNTPRPNCLYIASMGILPKYQGQGFGSKQKQWQLDFARHRHCKTIVTNMRQNNVRVIRLNAKFGFTQRETSPGYYSDPDEAALVMELRL